jgi:hypothetical protein
MQPKSKWVIVAFVLFTLVGYGVKYNFFPITDLTHLKPLYYFAFGIAMFFGFKNVDTTQFTKRDRLISQFCGVARISLPIGSFIGLLHHFFGRELALQINLALLVPLLILCFYIIRKELKRKAST